MPKKNFRVSVFLIVLYNTWNSPPLLIRTAPSFLNFKGGVTITITEISIPLSTVKYFNLNQQNFVRGKFGAFFARQGKQPFRFPTQNGATHQRS